MAYAKRGVTREMANSAKANPKARYAAQRHPRPAMEPSEKSITGPLPKDSAVGAIQPIQNPNWHKFVKAWWKALGMSDTARIYQEIDWVNAWVAADVLDQMYDDGFTAGLLKEWHAMVEKLHVPRADLLTAEPEADPDDVDEDEQEAEAAITDLRSRLQGTA